MSVALRNTNAEASARIGPYRLESVLGRDSVGEVYLGIRVDGEFDQRVAVKLLPHGSYDDVTLERFKRERQIAAALNHPNIAHFYGGGTSGDGSPYFVMEYVGGATLFEYCEGHQLNLSERLAIFRQICQAIQAAHEADVLHGDIKPENILVTDDGIVKLLDFGLRRCDPDASLAPGRFSPSKFDAPECTRGEPVTVASDVFSLGVILSDIAVGNFTSPNDQRVTTGLLAIIQKAAAQHPEERYSEARDLYKAVESLLSDSVVSESASVISPSRPQKPTLAILPFDAEGTDAAADAFGVGIADSLVSRISRL
ncbi:MAG TPA: serine/threonine-protein kinase, partial [Pyrinomonadaceae bacterium]|nr:serine/threonine-protein kinase [Pyrinomonadaceae bacterium]